MQKQRKPFSLMAFIRPHRAGFITSTVLAVLSVTSGMIPYFAVARMVNLLISGEKNFSIYLENCTIALRFLEKMLQNLAYLWQERLQLTISLLPRLSRECW